MADEQRQPPHSLKDRTADQIRDERRDGGGSPATGASPELSPASGEAVRQAWSEPGGEAMSYRDALIGAGAKVEDHSELVAAETPETHRHLGDASLTPAKPQGAAKEAVDRATASVGADPDDDR